METLQTVLEWAKANPWVATAIVVYVIANVAPRPDPGKMSGWQRAFWLIVDRLCILTHDRLPGGLKMLLLDSPAKAGDKPKDETKVKPKKPKKPEKPAEDDRDDQDEPSEKEAEPDSDGDKDEKGAPP
jgi:hypothetical protein